MRAVRLGRSVVAVAALLLIGAARTDAASCNVSATSIAFGAYDVFTPAPSDSLGTVVLSCNGGAKNVAIEISPGQTGTFAARRLTRASDNLLYNVYVDAARTTVWGDGSSGSQVHIERNPPNNKDLSVTMFGRVPASQDVSAGSYSDTLTVTVNF